MVSKSLWFSSLWRTSWKNAPESEKLVIGVLAFEVTSLMSKVVHLWECLSDKQVARVKDEIMVSDGVRSLVSDEDDFIVGLVCGEIFENLECVARSVGRLGKKCCNPIMQRFDHVFDDFVQNDLDLYGLEYTWKKMERKVKKMGRLIAFTSSLYQELEVLAELEQVLRRMQVITDPKRGGLLEFRQKVAWQRQEVKNLREVSLWSRTYDYTVHLLARSLFTIVGRIKCVFQIHRTTDAVQAVCSRAMCAGYLPRSQSFSALMHYTVHPSESKLAKIGSGPLTRTIPKFGPVSGTNRTRRSTIKTGPIPRTDKISARLCKTEEQSFTLRSNRPHSKTKPLTSVGPFKGCMLGGSDSPILKSCAPVSSGFRRSSDYSTNMPTGAKNDNVDPLVNSNILHANLSLFCSKCKVLTAPPSTLGGAALAPHYANIIIVIEKLVAYPHLIGPDARDDLYNMLPRSLRAGLRARLKSYKKNPTSTVYDTDLAAQWTEALSKILRWLAPLAHNMRRWQSERNFEQQHMVSRTNVLLVQTLHFADQAKTEAAITELLVGLHYLWRCSYELNGKALLECASNTFDDCLYVKR